MSADTRPMTLPIVEGVAVELWHRFGCGSVETWADESAKAEYRHAAAGVLEKCRHAELVNAAKRLLACSPPSAAADNLEQVLAKLGGDS